MTKLVWYRCCLAAAVLGLANGVVGIIALIVLHGDATDSKVVDGHYYFVSHRRTVEVSRGAYDFSRWHHYSLMVTTPLCLVAAVCANYLSKPSKSDDSAA